MSDGLAGRQERKRRSYVFEFEMKIMGWGMVNILSYCIVEELPQWQPQWCRKLFLWMNFLEANEQLQQQYLN